MTLNTLCYKPRFPNGYVFELPMNFKNSRLLGPILRLTETESLGCGSGGWPSMLTTGSKVRRGLPALYQRGLSERHVMAFLGLLGMPMALTHS